MENKMNIDNYWQNFIKKEFKEPYYRELVKFLNQEYENKKTIYPPKEQVFNAFAMNPEDIKVIILGQDPYHGSGQANGFAFSVSPNVKLPPSLKNIYKEIENEYGYTMSVTNGDLTAWAKQGVMLLNSVLTVEHSLAASHKNKGWEIFTDKVIKHIAYHYDKKVFMLWGNYAINKAQYIEKSKHLILTSPHPSPFSAHNGFFGNGHFKKANEFLRNNNIKEVDWKIE